MVFSKYAAAYAKADVLSKAAKVTATVEADAKAAAAWVTANEYYGTYYAAAIAKGLTPKSFI